MALSEAQLAGIPEGAFESTLVQRLRRLWHVCHMHLKSAPLVHNLTSVNAVLEGALVARGSPGNCGTAVHAAAPLSTERRSPTVRAPPGARAASRAEVHGQRSPECLRSPLFRSALPSQEVLSA